MQRLTREDLQHLAAYLGTDCVSIYMPTHRAGPQVRQDPIRLKNLLSEATRALAARDAADDSVEELLRPINRLVDDREFWRDQGDGLAAFSDHGERHLFRLPMPVEQQVTVGRRFHVKPLIQVLAHNGRFYILSLSRNRVRLYEATRFTLRELDAEDIPDGMADAVGYDWEQRSLQFHSSTPSGTGDRSAEFHGQAVGRDDVDGELERFIQLVARGVEGIIQEPGVPLVLAAVEELFGEFRKHVRHTTVADDFIRGNPDDIPDKELHARAFQVVEPIFVRRCKDAAQRTRARLATGRAVEQVEDVVVAAAEGRIDELFVADDAIRWGRFEPERRRVEIHAEPEPTDEDLLNRAAVETINHDGTVFVVPSDQLPSDRSPAAASLRF